MNVSMDGLAWVWRAPAPDDGTLVEVPLPQGASFTIQATHPRIVVGWEVPPGVDPDVLAVAFGAEWGAALATALPLRDGVQVPPPPTLGDAWARVGLVHALTHARVPALDPDLLTVDEALAWDGAGHQSPAGMALSSAAGTLQRLVDDALTGNLPAVCLPHLQAVCELSARFGDPAPATELSTGVRTRALAPASVDDLTEGTAASALQSWLLHRLAAAAQASGLVSLASQLADQGSDVRVEDPAMAPTLAELVAVHDLVTVDAPDAVTQPPAGEVAPTLDAVLRATGQGPDHVDRDRVQAALEVYRRLGITDRARETEQLLADLDVQWAAQVADLDDLDLALSFWQFEFSLATTASARGTDDMPATGRVVLDDPELYLELMGRPRTDIDRWATLTVTTTGSRIDVELVLPGEPAVAVTSVRVVVPTTTGPVKVHLNATSTLELSGQADLPSDATTTPGHVRVSEVHHAH